MAPQNHWRPLFAIGLIVGVLALAFAWAIGWIAPGRLTTGKFTTELGAGSPEPPAPGFRRAHAKGCVCLSL